MTNSTGSCVDLSTDVANQWLSGKTKLLWYSSDRTVLSPAALSPFVFLEGFCCFAGASNGFNYPLALSLECVEQLRELF